jgi:flagellar basal body-associated protein FliL
MKKVLLTLLAVVIVLGLFAAVGLTGYRFGYVQGAQRAADRQRPELRAFDEMGPNRMPMQNFGNRFDRDFGRGFGPGGFPMRGFGFFPLMFLGRIAILALIVGFVYWLFTHSGWRLTRTVQPVEAQSKPAEPEAKE